MFELHYAKKVIRWRARLRESLYACQALTLRRRIAHALAWCCFGQAVGAALLAALFVRYEHLHPAPVEIRQPALEHSGTNLTVVRVGFAYRGVESVCRFVIHHNASYDWSARC